MLRDLQNKIMAILWAILINHYLSDWEVYFFIVAWGACFYLPQIHMAKLVYCMQLHVQYLGLYDILLFY